MFDSLIDTQQKIAKSCFDYKTFKIAFYYNEPCFAKFWLKAGEKPEPTAAHSKANRLASRCLTLLSVWDCPTKINRLEAKMERQKLTKMMDLSERMYLRRRRMG